MIVVQSYRTKHNYNIDMQMDLCIIFTPSGYTDSQHDIEFHFLVLEIIWLIEEREKMSEQIHLGKN